MDILLTDLTISMSDFKKNPAKAIRDAGAQPVAVLNRNKAAFYMVNPDVFEAMMDQIDEARLAPLVKARMARGHFVAVDPKDL